MSSPEDLDKFDTLAAVIARLRSPGGCPWDREQTHASLRGNLLQECYEVLAALDEAAPARLCDEMGDLLLQIVLHAQIASEAGDFEMGDVIRGINTKLVRRHPHIFGSATAKDAEEVAHNWEALKKQERAEDASLLETVPRHMPALGYSQEIQRRVARVGFDWPDSGGVIDKLVEEVRELKEAEGPERRAQEFGDLLFTLVNVARREGVDSEAALREASQRFRRRFAHMEAVCRQRGLSFDRLSPDEQNTLWEEAKKAMGKGQCC
ncbi:MAG: nucleoside triphosphate pyrophosphohydrolase [Chloroflexota bacterium]